MNQVARKVSNAINHASTLVYSPDVEQDDIPEQAKFLCYRYMSRKLRRTSIGSGGLGNMQIFQSRVDDDIVFKICCLADTLESLHPDTYSNLALKLQLKIQSERSVSDTFRKFADELFRYEVKWALILSLLTVAGNLGIECAMQGRSRFIGNILGGIADVTKKKLRKWIQEHGGWEHMVKHFETVSPAQAPSNTQLGKVMVLSPIKNCITTRGLLSAVVAFASISFYYFAVSVG